VNLPAESAIDAFERRFGGLRRLYGDAGYRRLRAARVAIVGVGGVGSWAAEALARSGVAELTLVDLDHVAESNINRQIHATEATLGQAKVEALRERIRGIHPGCVVHAVEAFVADPQPSAGQADWPALLPAPVDAVIDACDAPRAKLMLAAWALRERHTPLVIAGAAGGKRQAQRVAVEDLARVTHDPLLASLRQRLRKQHGAAGTGRIGLCCVYSSEAVQRPQIDDAACALDAPVIDNSLNCAGYGSVVTVTATFGMVAAGVVIEWITGKSAPAS
jgi:tRNA threonylcarbamoyladenosine dehydratase